MSVLQGLYKSINTITSQSAAQLDFCNIQKLATAAGVANGHTNQPYDLSSIANLIGTQDVAPLDMANAYATFAAGGVPLQPSRPGLHHGRPQPHLPGARRGLQTSHQPGRGSRCHLCAQERPDQGHRLQLPVNKDQDIFAKTGTTDGNTMTWTVGAQQACDRFLVRQLQGHPDHDGRTRTSQSTESTMTESTGPTSPVASGAT